MSDLLNTGLNPRSSFNTGTGKRALERARIANVVFLPHGTTFSAANRATQATFMAALLALVQNDDPLQRAYVFNIDGDFKQMSSDSQKVTLGYGGTRWLAKGMPGFQVDFNKGGMDTFQNLLKYDNCQDLFDLLVIDKKGVVYGCNRTYNNGNTFGGWDIGQIHTPNNEFQTSNAIDVYRIYIELLNAEQFNEAFDFFATGISNVSAQLPLIIDVTIVATTGPSANKISVQVKGGYSREGLTKAYSAILNSTTAWTATKVSDGTAGTISAVAYTAATDTFDLTITSGTGLIYAIGMTALSVLIPLGFVRSGNNFEWNQNAFTNNTDNQATAG